MKSITHTNTALEAGLPVYSPVEETLNWVSHGIGTIFAVIAFILLMPKHSHTIIDIICIAVYCLTLFMLYGISTLYHALKIGKAKRIFRKLDHCSIFLLIAGTYTPLCLLYINTPMASRVLLGVWVTAAVGIILNLIDVNRFSKISLSCYLLMGWSVVIMANQVIHNLTSPQLSNLIIGGIFYTVGAVLYVIGKKVQYMHCVWHLFVLAGSVFHFLILY